MGIFEILLLLAIALIVIPPDDLPQVLRAAGRVMRELRLASNTVMRELSSAIGDEQPFNLLPPRFDDEIPPAPPSPAGSPASATDLAPASSHTAAPQVPTSDSIATSPEPDAIASNSVPAANVSAQPHAASAEPSTHAAATKP